MNITERLIAWLEWNKRPCEERDLLNDALEELEQLRTFIKDHSHSHGLRMDGTSVWWMRGMVGTGRDVFEAIEAAKGGAGWNQLN